MFTIHKNCHYCNKIGHRADMKKVIEFYRDGDDEVVWYHVECYMKHKSVVPCPCGNGYVYEVASGAIKTPKGGTGETRKKI